MSLISTEVEVGLSQRNRKYYEELGYQVPHNNRKIPRGTTIIVKIEHLPEEWTGSVKIKCDGCGEMLSRRWGNFLKSREKWGEFDYCVKCIPKPNKKKIEDVLNIFTKKKYKPLFDENDYKDARTILPYLCLKHPEEIQYTNYTNMATATHCCEECIKEDKSQRYKDNEKEVFNYFKNKNLIPTENAKYINTFLEIPCVCTFHPNNILHISYNNIKRSVLDYGCPICNPRDEWFKGEKGSNWKGGISNLAEHLRTCIIQWNKDSMKNCNYKCVITGGKFDTVHHLHGFNSIVFETLEMLNLTLHQHVNEYSEEELTLIDKTCLELHYKYDMGVCLSKRIHDLFHDIYGKGNNTPDQFNEFKQNIESGLIREQHF